VVEQEPRRSPRRARRVRSATARACRRPRPATPSTTAPSSGNARPGDPDLPTRPVLLLQGISQRQRWKADYTAAQLAARKPLDGRSAATDHAKEEVAA
jgi:hypothetical protein